MERFGVSPPSLREALRILEAEGLISVLRGTLGGVVVHQPDERMTARTAALVLQARNVSLDEARCQHITYASEDVREGFTAYLERREARFRGR